MILLIIDSITDASFSSNSYEKNWITHWKHEKWYENYSIITVYEEVGQHLNCQDVFQTHLPDNNKPLFIYLSHVILKFYSIKDYL